MEIQDQMTKKQKAWKITSLVINIVSIVIMVFAVFIVVSSLASKDKGYTVYFGKAYAVVQSDSMAKDLTKPDNFQKGDVIAFRVLSDQEKGKLKVEDVITFWDYNIPNIPKALNTHRIIEIIDEDGDGVAEAYKTKGDNNPGPDPILRQLNDVQGVYAGKSPFLGRILTFLQSKTGFAVFIVVPCVLIVIYCLTLVVMNLMKYAKSKAVMQREDDVDKLKAELKAELLKEMAENKGKDKEAEAETQDDDSKEELATDSQEEKANQEETDDTEEKEDKDEIETEPQDETKEETESVDNTKEENADTSVEDKESKQENKESE